MRTLLILLASLAIPAFALASHPVNAYCSGPPPAQGIIEITADRPDATVYLDDRNVVSGNGLWFYVETNGIWSSHGAPGFYVNDEITRHNLQRGGTSTILLGEPDWCSDAAYAPPDHFLLV